MKKALAKKLYKKISAGGVENENPFDVFKKINYELLRAMKIVADKIKDNKVDDIRQKSFSRALIIIYTIQTNLNFDKDQQTSIDLFRFYEYCRSKLIDGVSSLSYKGIYKSVVSLDDMFNFKYINQDL
jgi:flagellin-specific chaperone FliS